MNKIPDFLLSHSHHIMSQKTMSIQLEIYILRFFRSETRQINLKKIFDLTHAQRTNVFMT